MHSFHLGSSPETTRRFETEPVRAPPLPCQIMFVDAEGTLWVPRPGRTTKDFWESPSRSNAREIFEPTPGVHGTLARLRAGGCRLVVLSRHNERLLPDVLEEFRLDTFFEDVLVNGDKGERAVEWLETHAISRTAALMVGDREDLDIAPMRRVGIPAMLLDRPYNRQVDAPRLGAWEDLIDWMDRTASWPSREEPSIPAPKKSKRL